MRIVSKNKENFEEIAKKLEKHFNDVRLVYFYNAYSTGYRAIFCLPASGPCL